jgi:hypothetical protein
VNRRTKGEILAAWRRVLTADLPPEVTSARVAETVGIARVSARQWLTNHVGPGTVHPGPKGGLVGTWPTDAIRAAVEAMEGPGNRSENRGRGRPRKTASSQSSQEGTQG